MPSEQYGEEDVLVYSMGSGGHSMHAMVWLATGECYGKVSSRKGLGPWSVREAEFTMDGPALDQVREAAQEIHARGDFEYRDQFPQAGVGFEVTLGGSKVSARYDVDGSVPHYDGLEKLIMERVRSHTEDPE